MGNNNNNNNASAAGTQSNQGQNASNNGEPLGLNINNGKFYKINF
jgi:hypothetical protein